jgi:hypothetical protein
MDSASIPAKRDATTGPNTTDLGKAGTECYLASGPAWPALAFVLTGANVHDSVSLAELLDAVGACQRQVWKA